MMPDAHKTPSYFFVSVASAVVASVVAWGIFRVFPTHPPPLEARLKLSPDDFDRLKRIAQDPNESAQLRTRIDQLQRQLEGLKRPSPAPASASKPAKGALELRHDGKTDAEPTSKNDQAPPPSAIPGFKIIAPTAGSVFAPGQEVPVRWTGGSPSWSVNVSLIDSAAWTVVKSAASNLPNRGSLSDTFPTTLSFDGPCGRSYLYYVENVERTTWTYGSLFSVVCPSHP